MCGTLRSSPSSETCSYCGFIFEDNLGSPGSYSSEDIPPTVEDLGIDNSDSPITSTEFSSTPRNESPLRTMTNVICKNSRSVREGLLILTNRRLVFVPGRSGVSNAEISQVLQSGENFAIPLEQIATVSGNRGILRPSLNVVWHNSSGDSSTTKTDFLQNYRPKNLEEARNGINEWVPLIEKAATSDVSLEELPVEETPLNSVDEAELESRVLEELGDNQWKGFFQISKELGEKYNASVDPDALERICNQLVKEKVIEQDKHGEFFRKIQPAGKK